tara:strand:+ start:178 stop:1989 length:1812 start_codon:yes stop_codon:yes gene_type:complete
METYISAPIIDKQNDKIPTETIKESMDFYMKYGVYSYRHEEQPIGLPLAYKIKNGKVKVRVGIHDKLSMHNKVWKEIQEFGSTGASSIRGEAMDQEKVCDEDSCHNQINELDLWSVSWVGDNPANPEATVRQVAMAKAKSTVQVTLDEVESMVEKIIERKNGKYCLFAKKDRKLLGCHDTREGAVRQERAIQARRYSKSKDILDDILKSINIVKAADDPKTPAKPSERRRGSTRNPRGSAGATRGGIKLSAANIKTLENYRDEHNKKVGDAKGKKANLGALKAVFRRGAGAFSTSHRPSVRSRDQWALGRVKAFLRLLSSGRPSNPKYTTDYDLLPAGHPKSTKKEMKTLKVKPPEGHHWMAYKDGPVLMVGDYAPHEGAVEAFEFEVIEEHDDSRLVKAEYQGRKVELNKPFRLNDGKKKFGVYVKNDKGNVVQVKFGDPKLDIKRDDPERRRNFRARHNCDNPGPKYKARYWSCKMWSSKRVSDILGKGTMTTVSTESLKKSNDHLNDIMQMLEKGVSISKKKTPGKVWFENCLSNVRRLENIPNRQEVRDDRAFCSELWYNPGRFDKTYKKPGGGTGRTSGMQFRLDMGTSTGPSGLRGF